MFIHTFHFCFLQKIANHIKRNWLRFSLLRLYRTNIYVINIVKISNRFILNLFSCLQQTSMDSCKVHAQTFVGLYFSENAFIDRILKHITYSSGELLIFFWLTLVDILCLKFGISQHQRNTVGKHNTPKERKSMK